MKTLTYMVAGLILLPFLYVAYQYRKLKNVQCYGYIKDLRDELIYNPLYYWESFKMSIGELWWGLKKWLS